MQTGDIRLIKNINVRLVLNLIREHGEISGAKLAHITGMRPSTISNILKELKEKDLIINMGKGESTNKGGKKPYLWGLNDDSNYIIGLDIEIGEITALLLNLKGDIIFQKIHRTEVFENLKKFADQIKSVVDDMVSDFKIKMGDVLGMGIAVAGIVNNKEGVIKATDILPDQNIPLLSSLQDYFDFPVIIENNANAAALGTKWVGEGKQVDNFITVLIELHKQIGGLGLGLVINQNLYHGSSYCAGELNVTIPTLDEKLIELKRDFFKGKILKKYINALDDINIDVMIDAANNGDKVAINYFKNLGKNLGKQIQKVVLALNPDKVILTGQVAKTGNILANTVCSKLKEELQQIHIEEFEVAADENGRYIVSIGAAALILDEFFKVPLVNTKTKVTL